jgi:hypothetical protein
MGQITTAGGQPGLQIALEAEQQLGRLLVKGQHSRPVISSRSAEAGGEGLELQGVAVGDQGGYGWGAGLAAADQALGEAVEKPGQQAAAAEPGPAGQAAQDFGLDGEPDG